MNLSPFTVFVLLIGYRLLNSFTVCTFFQPDEYYQALEPAFYYLYGYGFLTWEWKHKIRGSIVPLLYQALFRLSESAGLDILVAPRIFHGLCAALVDWFTLKLALATGESRSAARYALLASVFSVNQWFTSTRSFSNNLEALLCLIALTQWPFDIKSFQYRSYACALFFAQLAICLRPTNAIIWLLLGARLLAQTLVQSRYKLTLNIAMLAMGSLLLVQGVELRTNIFYFGEWVWPLLEFVKVNLGKDKVSHYYGMMPWHFYLSAAGPLLLMGQLPFAIYGGYKRGLQSILVQLTIFSLIIYSSLAHKELRFLYFLMPFMHVFVGGALASVPKMRTWFKWVTVAQIPIAILLSHVNQRGVIDVIEWFRADEAASRIESVTFLMPCHSTPWRSHLRRPNLDAYFLTCDPMITVAPELREDYLDEGDNFYLDPYKWLKAHPERLTQSLVLFEALEPTLRPLLDKDYRLETRFFNSFFTDDARRSGDVLVYTRI